MTRRHFSTLFAVTAIICLGPLPAVSQTQINAGDSWTPPRTPDGRPDLQGRWTMATFTPLEHPDRFAGREFLAEEEAAALMEQLTAKGVDPLRNDALSIADSEAREEAVYQVNRDRSYVHYDNEIWLSEERPKGLSSRRTSLIVDPPDGRLPSLTLAAQKRESQTAARSTDSYESRTLSERCIASPNDGPPMLPPIYNDILQIFQTPDYVVIFQEMSNMNPRIVPMDGRPHLPQTIRLWPGDSRGYWQGETWSSRRRTSPRTRQRTSPRRSNIIGIFASVDPARPCVWSSGLRGWMPTGSTTNSRLKIPRHGRAPGLRKSR